MKKVIFAFLAVLIMTGCSVKENTYRIVETEQGKVILNRAIPANPDFAVNLKYSGQIFNRQSKNDSLGFNWMMDIVELPDRNYAVLGNNTKGQILLYNSDYEIIRSFSKLGYGPGESNGYSRLLLMNNKLYAFFNGSDQVNVFDPNGEFIESFRFGFIITEITKLSEKRLIATRWEHLTLDSEKDELTIENILMDNNFKKIKIVDSYYKTVDHKLSAGAQLYPFICGNETDIYISWISDSEYKIDVYNTESGEKKYQIKKDYRIYYYNDSEMDRMSEMNKVNMKEKFGRIKKRAINEIFTDKYAFLWVLGTKERSSDDITVMYADIFKDGVYINTVNFLEFVYYDWTGSRFYYKLRFIAGKLIYFNADEFNDERGRCIKFFDY
ncbi:MAG: lipoprotein [Candidatus Pacebacteria bacterium]|nr:lipoprotein [Candidatus Paceibacterota bacterium]